MMFKKNIITFFSACLIYIIQITFCLAEITSKIVISGNDRISDETIIMFSDLNTIEFLNEREINSITKKLYQTNYFEKITIKFKENILYIDIIENPIIQDIQFTGIKAKKILDKIDENLKLKSRSSYSEIFLKKDKQMIISNLKGLGYYFAEVEVLINDLEDNKVDVIYDIKLGEKGKIKKISFIGNKIFKDKKLRNIIVSEEYRFWKILSGSKKYLNQEVINFDNRLLKNFYLNKGYYNVKVNSSFAKLLNNDEFELIFNINAEQKVFFGNLELDLPNDFDLNNFESLNKSLKKAEGTPYSINQINNILDKIDEVVISEQFESIKATVKETLEGDKINLKFSISDLEKTFVSRINIFGNNVTQENVIRNQLLIDEGDPYNEILKVKSINNIKSLNFFKKVESDVLIDKENNSKIINITIEEKPTGEIMAGAGVGSAGGTFTFGVKENNYLGRGIGLDFNIDVNKESLKGQFIVDNQNFLNSDKSIFFSALATETDKLAKSGYKNNKAGFSIGTKYEYLDDFFLGIRSSNFHERIETDSTASARQQKQKGNYWDSFLELDFDLDKRNQKYQTTKGFFSMYKTKLPLISDTNSFTNSYRYKYFTELFENNVTSISFLAKSSFSLTDEDIKLSERLNIPTQLLRGFEPGKVGPKDGNDFIGGNYISSLNFSSTLPQALESFQNADMIFFLDIANIWGVDYDKSLEKNDDIKSSVGVGIDWFTPIGPLNFSLSQPISKSTSDVTETFRFNLGTTF